MRSVIAASKRLVVKVGSSLVTNDGRGLDHAAIARWASQIAALREQGKEVVMVSSGAIAEGIHRLGWTKRPREIDELQAAAAVGQMGLAQVYESSFGEARHPHRANSSDARRSGRSRALSERSLDAADLAASGCRADHQRKRHRHHRRNQVRRQRHPRCAGGESDRRRRADYSHRSARPVHRRSAQGPDAQRSSSRPTRERPNSKAWRAARARALVVAACSPRYSRRNARRTAARIP